jgi:hypothetical protein
MKAKFAKYAWLLIVLSIFSFAIYKRITLFHQVGGDVDTYVEAVEDFINGLNPYVATVETFKHLDTNPGNKGFSYLPGLLYVNTFFYSIYLFLYNLHPCNPLLLTGFCTPMIYFWKVPILLADIGVGILLYKLLADKSKLATLVALLVWFVNPFIYLKNDFITNDAIPIFFMLFALYNLGKDEIASGASYALAVGTKTFPIFILPVMFINSSDKKKFFLAAGIVGIAMSLPFMGSIYDFTTYLNGSVFVHGNRFVQGRPFLFYLSYWKSIEFFQIVPLWVYTLLASFGGWLAVIIVRALGWVKDKFALSVIPFLVFYLFTPVLNRTYLLWFIPVFILGLFNVTYGYTSTEGNNFFGKLKFKHSKILYYLVLVVYWYFYYWYLAQWKDGFHIHAKI